MKRKASKSFIRRAAMALLLALMTTLTAWADYVYADEGRSKVYSGPLEVQANVSHPDVNEARGITGDHGFDADIPIADAGTYWVKILAIDTQVGEITQVTVTGPPSGAEFLSLLSVKSGMTELLPSLED